MKTLFTIALLVLCLFSKSQINQDSVKLVKKFVVKHDDFYNSTTYIHKTLNKTLGGIKIFFLDTTASMMFYVMNQSPVYLEDVTFKIDTTYIRKKLDYTTLPSSSVMNLYSESGSLILKPEEFRLLTRAAINKNLSVRLSGRSGHCDVEIPGSHLVAWTESLELFELLKQSD